jgi:anti-sigma regulatory factor (Ser/Thr protein kinase)
VSDEERILAMAASGAVTAEQVRRALRVSRATAHRRIKALVDAGRLEQIGAARAAVYVLAPAHWVWPRDRIDELTAWKQMEPALRALSPMTEPEANTLYYAISEMVNNAMDHSGGKHVRAAARRVDGDLEVEISDDGVGIFEHVRRAKQLPSAEDAIVQLEKGKLTTDPARHTGEGLFFTSKVVRRFRLESGKLAWLVDNQANDRAVQVLDRPVRGTRIVLTFTPGEIPELQSVFQAWTDAESGEFNVTRTTVRLAAHGKALISRSEAKRIVAGLEKFAVVELDFTGVDVVGQGFADEVFRVFSNAHPRIRLEPTHMSPSVAFMVGRARR